MKVCARNSPLPKNMMRRPVPIARNTLAPATRQSLDSLGSDQHANTCRPMMLQPHERAHNKLTIGRPLDQSRRRRMAHLSPLVRGGQHPSHPSLHTPGVPPTFFATQPPRCPSSTLADLGPCAKKGQETRCLVEPPSSNFSHDSRKAKIFS